MQNIYDNEVFYTNYLDLRENKKGLNEVLEIPAFRALLPDLHDKTILDLGCGFGEASHWYITQGAKKVIGIDISAKMIQRAKELYTVPNIEYYNISMEDFNYSQNYFDFVFSSLAFHYVADFESLVKKLNKIIKSNGILIFSQEHPITTAKKVSNGWVKDEHGNKLHWRMDDYDEEGKREQKWFIDGVIKYHRKMSSILNSLIANGFAIEHVGEPIATDEAERSNERLKEERKRPPFLIIKARRI